MNGRTRSGRGRLCFAVVCVILAALAGPMMAGYGLSLTPTSDTIQHVSPGGTAEFHFTLTNTGSSTDVFRFDCLVVSGVPSWTVVYCARGVCVEPGTSIYDTVPAAGIDTSAKVTVYTDTTQGEEVAFLSVRSMGDTTLAESVATHTIVGLGIEEDARLDAPEAGVKVVPTLVSRQTGASVVFATRERTFFRVTLHDAAGRLVQTAAAGIVPAGLHHVDWLPGRGLPRGLYLLHVSAGDESAVSKVIVE
jgi:hypothetical protein